MLKNYKDAMSAQKVRGQRVHDVRVAAFNRGVTAQGGTFLEISQGVQTEFDKTFKAHIDKLIKDIDNVFDSLQRDVNRVCSTKEDDGPEAKKFRDELLEMLPQARERLENEICRHLGYCKMSRTNPL